MSGMRAPRRRASASTPMPRPTTSWRRRPTSSWWRRAGCPTPTFLDAGAELATTGWDILSGAVRPAASVLLYDDNGAHPGMTAAEFIAGTGAVLEVVTPERSWRRQHDTAEPVPSRRSRGGPPLTLPQPSEIRHGERPEGAAPRDRGRRAHRRRAGDPRRACRTGPLALDIVDPSAELGRGAAYGTVDPCTASTCHRIA